ncbi:hypothetical protein Micbo1qcDRAFT_161539, partial [Microdochium bolleyi]
MDSSAISTQVTISQRQSTLPSPAENDIVCASAFGVFFDTDILYQSTFGAAGPTDLSVVDVGEWWNIMCYHDLPFLQLLDALRTTLLWPINSPQDSGNALRDNGVFSLQLLFLVSLPRSYLHCLPSFFRAHDESLQSSGALSWELDPFHVLAKAIYRLSNNLVGVWYSSVEDCLLYE